MGPALELVLDGKSDFAKASETKVYQGGLLAASGTHGVLQMLCGRLWVFPQAVLDGHSLCKPIAACCQFHNMQQLIVFVFSQERG